MTDEDVQAEVDAIKKNIPSWKLWTAPRRKGMWWSSTLPDTWMARHRILCRGQSILWNWEAGRWVPGFEDQLIGAVADETREISLTFPEEYYEEVAGKDAVFEVYVHEVQEYVLDDWSDEFVQENLDYDSIADMESSIRANLEQTAEEEAESNLEYDLVAAFLEGCEFEIQDYRCRSLY